jgi:hypothetical protein
LDGTQTSEPTETGPGSPGQASAFRRALDEQAVSEGPLDLTVPLDIAEVRAALSNSGSFTVVRAATAAAMPPSPGARRTSRHASTKRLGRIAVFVALAATLSVGTACALVLSSGGQGSSVSLPPTDGNIPVAPSQKPSGQGQLAITSGSASASAVPSLSHSPKPVVQTVSAPATGASTPPVPSVSADPSVGTSQSASSSPSTGQAGGGASPTTSASSGWVTLYWGIQNESPEVAQVQTMLANLGYLDGLRRHTYFNPQVDVQPDPSGSYGSATEDAVAEFQQDYNVDITGQSGDCDLATYQALTQAAG